MKILIIYLYYIKIGKVKKHKKKYWKSEKNE